MNSSSRNLSEKVILRTTQPQDDSFLFQVYASTRADEMALVNWNEKQKNDFLLMQFNAQRQHYLTYFPHAEYSLICQVDRPIGRIIIDRSGEELLLMDITLLPEYRNSGIGTRLIENIQNEARAKGLPVRLHVETFNRALHLYERLGFSKIDENGIYLKMEWKPPLDEAAQDQKSEKDEIDA
jgi:ribosomal protein S18 acetylase RimI-like enzyme